MTVSVVGTAVTPVDDVAPPAEEDPGAAARTGGRGRSEAAELREIHPGRRRQRVELTLERRLLRVDVSWTLDGRNLGRDLLEVRAAAREILLLAPEGRELRFERRLLRLQLRFLGLEVAQLRILRSNENSPDEKQCNQGDAPDDQGSLILTDDVHLRFPFLSRLPAGVTETVKGNEMVESGLATVAPCSGLAKTFDPATALIHASEMERLGPGPVTEIWTVPIAADVGALEPPAAAPVDEDDPAEVVVAGLPAAAPVAAPPPVVTAAPSKAWTLAFAGVIEINVLRASGQSMAELMTEARRVTPAV